MKRVSTILDSLSQLMEEERRVLLAGDAAGLDRLAARKDRAMARLTAALADSPAISAGGGDDALKAALQNLHSQAGRSRDLLAAALDGLHDAQGMLDAMREMRLDTYSADGSRESLKAGSGRLERRT